MITGRNGTHMQRKISAKMDHPFDVYFQEKCTKCMWNRRCDKDRESMLFCFLTSSFEKRSVINGVIQRFSKRDKIIKGEKDG
jgi:hypothetical protein